MWKAETVHVIPKNSSPASLAELRNLSCTPLFSKVLESFILSNLKSEVSLSNSQYGGVKGCSTNHFLIDTWDVVLNALEKGESVTNLISVDFEKAFNRMNHWKCLEALAELGASDESIDGVATFLYNRTMSVKIGDAFSSPRHVPGGSPQGSILGNFLFCATTDCFTSIRVNVGEEAQSSSLSSLPSSSSIEPAQVEIQPSSLTTSTSTTRGQFARFAPPRSLQNPELESSSDEDIYPFFRARNDPFETTTEDQTMEDTININREALTGDELRSMVYIDDFNALERLRITNAPSHITMGKRQITVNAPQTEMLFEEIQQPAGRIGMKVNNKKTQMVCIHPYSSDSITSYIKAGEQRINSTSELKILGFHFGTEPNAKVHASKLIEKFYNKMWSLRFLKRSGMKKPDLLKVYKTVILPSVEYASVVYHSLIPQYQAEALEAMQKLAMSIIYGKTRYSLLIENKTIEPLAIRREKAILDFANKASKNERFRAKWFRENQADQVDRGVRSTTRRRYVEANCKTDRMRKNPVQVMIRALNDEKNNV